MTTISCPEKSYAEKKYVAHDSSIHTVNPISNGLFTSVQPSELFIEHSHCDE